jgi:hypothetical protein
LVSDPRQRLARIPRSIGAARKSCRLTRVMHLAVRASASDKLGTARHVRRSVLWRADYSVDAATPQGGWLQVEVPVEEDEGSSP